MLSRVVLMGSLMLTSFACGSSSISSPDSGSQSAPRRAAVETRGQLTLDVRVEGLRSNRGNVLVALYASEGGFPADGKQALRTQQSAIRGGVAKVRFPELAPGSYAVSVLHDENASGSLDTGFLGIPSEGLGASNDAQGRFSAADYDEAKFVLSANRAIRIEVRYFP